MKAVLLGLLLLPITVWAEEESKLNLTPTGRVLVDGAVYASPQKNLFPDGMCIPEARIGVNMKYGSWSSSIDVSYSYGKVGLRNLWIEYGFNPGNSIRVGNFIHQFGLQSTSSSVKCTFEQPMASAPFTPGLQLGAMFVHYDPTFYATASFHVESSALTSVMNAPLFNQQGYMFLTRLVARNPIKDAPVWHVGISGGFGTPQQRVEDNNDIHDGFTLSANYPTRTVQLAAAKAVVTDSKNSFKFSPEAIFAYKRFALESQYFFQQVNRRENLTHYQAQGAYVTLRGLLTNGAEYGYVSSSAQLARPKAKSLECVVDFNHLSLSDSKAGIRGGRTNAMSVTLNYYFNQYITGRLNYSYAHAWDRAGVEPRTFNGIQARLMVLF